jgi:hypothetical protein
MAAGRGMLSASRASSLPVSPGSVASVGAPCEMNSVVNRVPALSLCNHSYDARDRRRLQFAAKQKGSRAPSSILNSKNATGLSKQARHSCRFAILAIANVHGHFKTETHFGSSWLGPHSFFLS